MKVITLFVCCSVLISGACLANVKLEKQPTTSITLKIDELVDGADLHLQLRSNIFGAYEGDDFTKTVAVKEYIGKVRNHFVTFNNLPVSTARNATLSYHHQNEKFFIDFMFALEPGDSIFIESKNGKMTFSGKNSIKYQCQYSIDNINRENRIKIIYNEALKVPERVVEYFSLLDSLALKSLEEVDKVGTDLNDSIRLLMTWMVVRDYQNIKSTHLRGGRGRVRINLMEFNSALPFIPYLKTYRNPIWNHSIDSLFKSNGQFMHCTSYLEFVMRQYEVDSSLMLNKPFNLRDFHNYMKNWVIHKGPIYDYFFYNMIKENRYDPDMAKCIDDEFAGISIKNESAVKYLMKTRQALSPKSKAFNFSLRDVSRKTVRQSDYSGKVVLLYFWLPGTERAVAPIIPYLKKIDSSFSDRDFEIISICFDNFDSWKRTVLDSPATAHSFVNLCAGEYTSVAPDISKHYQVESIPQFILIGKDGRLLQQNIVLPQLDNGINLLNRISEAIQK